MSLRAGENTVARPAPLDDESDAEEEIMAQDFQEQVQYEDGMDDGANGFMGGPQDVQAQLAALAIPLDFQATLETKMVSYDNYCSVFHYILNSEGPVDLEAPSVYWAWDVIDEFIYQFNSFCSYRQRVALKAENSEEISVLRENSNIWGCYSVLNVLYSLIQRSQISEQLAAMKRGDDPAQFAGEYGNRSLYKSLGYFSIIGLLR
ncbi:hypothetical protein LTR60_002403, partial [Cryomyces antarcticus]